MARLHFFLGKGGVGKSTLSISYSCLLAKEGDTLLVSLDPAHNLSDLLGIPLGDKPKKILENLEATEVNVEKATRGYLSNILKNLELRKELMVWNLEKNLKILEMMPGAEEEAILMEIENLRRLNYENVVVDMPPTGLALRVFLLPHLVLFWLKNLIQLRRKIRERREIIRSLEKGEDYQDKVIPQMEKLIQRYDELINHLRDQKMCSIFLVAEPSEVSIREAKRIRGLLKERGYPIKALFVNKIQGEMPEVASEGFEFPVFKISYFETDPIEGVREELKKFLKEN
jgi:arsenite-transporting ATPase